MAKSRQYDSKLGTAGRERSSAFPTLRTGVKGIVFICVLVPLSTGHEIEVRSTSRAAAIAFRVLTEPDLRPVSISAK